MNRHPFFPCLSCFAVIGANSISLKYDPSGNRIQKNSSVNGNRKYIVDVVGDLPVILLELETTDFTDYTVKKAYIYANSQILSEHNGDYTTSQYFYLHDRLGSVRQVINSVGSVVKLYTYSPFGETIEEDGTFYTPWQFTGQYLDSETGQYYLRARQYSPYLARFTGRDLIVGSFDDPMSLHKYLYCKNDPINNYDLNGRWSTKIHNKLIDKAFDYFPTRDLEDMHAGSAFDDLPQFQDATHAYMHGMTDATTGQSVEDAQKKMWQFMNGKYAEYRKNLEEGNRHYAYNCLGQALHPIMDQTAPAHSWKPWGGLNYLPHVTDPFLDENDKTFKDTVKRMRNAMMSLEINYELGGFFKMAGWL